MYDYNSGRASRNIWVFWSSLSQRKISRRNIPSGRPNQSLNLNVFQERQFAQVFRDIWEYLVEYFNLWNWYAAMF